MSSQKPQIYQMSLSAEINLDKDNRKNKKNRLIDDKAYLDKANKLLKMLLRIRAIRFDESNDRLVISNFYGNNEKRVWPLQMLGYVAEVIVVRECRSNATKNEVWGKCARKLKSEYIPRDFSKSNLYENNRSLLKTSIVYEPFSSIASLNDYIAIGTGFPTTKTNYPNIYNPISDRDICWVNDVKQRSAIKGSNWYQQNFAGIQLKVSCGKKGDYVTNYFKGKPYDRLYPVVYFDLGNDFDQVRDNLINININEVKDDTLFSNNNENYSRVELVDMMLIRGKSIDPDLHEELLFYKHLLNQIFRGRYSFYELKDENILMSLISEYLNHNS